MGKYEPRLPARTIPLDRAGKLLVKNSLIIKFNNLRLTVQN